MSERSQHAGSVIPCIRREIIGYRYWSMVRGLYGCRQIGEEFFAVMGDFGDLVFVPPVVRGVQE